MRDKVSGIQLKESGIPLKNAIRNPSSTDKQSGIQYLESRIHRVESRIIRDLTNYDGDGNRNLKKSNRFM